VVEKLTPPRPTPIRPTGEIVGPEGAQEDVSSLTERAIMVRAYNVVLKVGQDVRMIRAGFSLELDGIKDRLGVLEGTRAAKGQVSLGAPPLPKLDDDDDETKEPSIHDWNQILAEAGHELSAKVKDPHNKFDSGRARAIALEVVQTVREKSELSTWRNLKALLPFLGKKALEALVPLIIGGFVVELLHLLGKLR
jgi:hypothetical protein